MLILPAIDLRGGICARLSQGRFDDVTLYGDPFARLASFAAAGARWVHIVDLDGAEAGAPRQHDLIGRLAGASALKLQVGGGVRTRAHVEALLQAGVARVVVGSASVRAPDEVRAWIADLGLERVCCAFDARPLPTGEFEVAVHGWRDSAALSLDAALALYPKGALAHALVTDISRDGLLQGPNLDLIAKLTRARPDLAIQASGGVASLADIPALRARGAAAAIVGRALYENRFSLEDALAS
jgi:phosphoribosylformimino-5-aminoimidazole carboxamide ribotide isomerase